MAPCKLSHRCKAITLDKKVCRNCRQLNSKYCYIHKNKTSRLKTASTSVSLKSSSKKLDSMMRSASKSLKNVLTNKKSRQLDSMIRSAKLKLKHRSPQSKKKSYSVISSPRSIKHGSVWRRSKQKYSRNVLNELAVLDQIRDFPHLRHSEIPQTIKRKPFWKSTRLTFDIMRSPRKIMEKKVSSDRKYGSVHRTGRVPVFQKYPATRLADYVHMVEGPNYHSLKHVSSPKNRVPFWKKK